MRITLKLFASLAPYMPAHAVDNAVPVELEEGATVDRVLDRFQVPRGLCHLVLVNGIFVPPARRKAHVLAEGDALAAWPPVAGG